MGRAKRVHRSKMQRRRKKPALPVQGDPGTSGHLTPALEGRPPAKRKESVEDPIADWPETDTVTDQWLIDRSQPEDPPNR